MQDYGPHSIRESAEPTGSFVAGTVIENLYLKNQLMLNIVLTIGTATSVSIKVEFSGDNSTFYQETIATDNGATGIIDHTLAERKFTTSGNYRIAIPIEDGYVRISTKGTGTLTTTTIGINAVTGVV